jgi:hypothetical protein
LLLHVYIGVACLAAAALNYTPPLQVDEHDSLKLFSADLEGMTFGDQAYEDKMHQLMEVRYFCAESFVSCSDILS